MLLSAFTRHSTGCKFSKDRACRRCNCPKWVGGPINGYYFHQSAKTRKCAEAEAVRIDLEEALAKGLPPFGPAVVAAESTVGETTTLPLAPAASAKTPAALSHEIRSKPKPRVTVAQAVEAYLSDAVSRSVETSTLKKLETIFRKQFLVWNPSSGFEYLDELDLDALLNSATPGQSALEKSRSYRSRPTTFLPRNSRGSWQLPTSAGVSAVAET
jgi:hypothetical protein